MQRPTTEAATSAAPARILVVDDDRLVLATVVAGLRQAGFEVLEAVRAADPTIVAVVITGYSTVGSAVEAMKAGAVDYLPKPFSPDQLTVVAKKALENRRILQENLYLRNELQDKYRFANIIGSSKKMQELFFQNPMRKHNCY